jgi:hypothetical protein
VNTAWLSSLILVRNGNGLEIGAQTKLLGFIRKLVLPMLIKIFCC